MYTLDPIGVYQGATAQHIGDYEQLRIELDVYNPTLSFVIIITSHP